MSRQTPRQRYQAQRTPITTFIPMSAPPQGTPAPIQQISRPISRQRYQPQRQQTTTFAPTTTDAPIQYWNCYLNRDNTRQDSWNDSGSGGGLGGASQIDASNTCNAWISNCGNYGGCTAYKVGTAPNI